MKGKILLPAAFMAFVLGCTSLHREGGIEYQGAVGPQATAPQASTHVNLSDGPGIAQLLNKNYTETTTSCTEYGTGKARGYYFCTGVLLRTTDDGAFNPWESSATAIQLKATSYSWIRSDLNTRSFYKPAGFILLNPADVLGGAVPGISYPKHTRGSPMVKCVYPFDAYTTRTMTRRNFGCGYEGSSVESPDNQEAWGSCDSVERFTTAAQWNNKFNSVGQVNYRQCSWNADKAQNWANSILSHSAYPTGQSSWNEVMLHNGGPTAGSVANVTEGMRLWTVAFFYDPARAGSLAIAQSFQRKMTATGKRVPIMRLDFTAAAAQRFQYLASDQVVGSYP